MKEEFAFLWDWKDQPDICKIIESLRKIEDSTGKKAICYDIETYTDSYGILLSIHKYDDKEKLRERWGELFILQDSGQE